MEKGSNPTNRKTGAPLRRRRILARALVWPRYHGRACDGWVASFGRWDWYLVPAPLMGLSSLPEGSCVCECLVFLAAEG